MSWKFLGKFLLDGVEVSEMMASLFLGCCDKGAELQMVVASLTTQRGQHTRKTQEAQDNRASAPRAEAESESHRARPTPLVPLSSPHSARDQVEDSPTLWL